MVAFSLFKGHCCLLSSLSISSDADSSHHCRFSRLGVLYFNTLPLSWCTPSVFPSGKPFNIWQQGPSGNHFLSLAHALYFISTWPFFLENLTKAECSFWWLFQHVVLFVVLICSSFLRTYKEPLGKITIMVTIFCGDRLVIKVFWSWKTMHSLSLHQ